MATTRSSHTRYSAQSPLSRASIVRSQSARTPASTHPAGSRTQTPVDLVKTSPNRTLPTVGDVLCAPQRGLYWLVPQTPSTHSSPDTTSATPATEPPADGVLTRLWLSGLDSGTTDHVARSEVEYNCEYRGTTIEAAGVKQLRDIPWLVDPELLGETDQSTQQLTSVDQLSVIRDRDRIGVNAFLEHPQVDHDLGSVVGWKACFTATYRGRRVATAVLSRPSASALDATSVITLSRYAAHPARPPNTASWLLAHARRWAALEAYDELRTYAGVSNDNEGTIYQAAGFTHVTTDDASGDGWQNRAGRDEWNDYTRRRYAAWLDAAVRPNPTTGINAQTTLTELSPAAPADDPKLCRCDHVPDWAHDAYTTHSPTPTVSITDVDALFGLTTGSTLHAVLPVSITPQRSETPSPIGTLHGIAADTGVFEYPTNALTAAVAAVRDWCQLEGADRLQLVADSELEHQVAKQAGIAVGE